MKPAQIKMELILPVAPEIIYAAWLNSKSHSAFTGGKAKINSDFSAWDGYITGEITELEENKKITQTWRTAEFPETAENSILEISLKPFKKGTKLTLMHTMVPKGDEKKYTDGWKEFYFIPMKSYFTLKK